VVFDAYGTLFDVHSVVVMADTLFAGQGRTLSETWRAKQLEYCFLRTIGQRYVDFWEITRAALEHSAEQLGLPLTAEASSSLMQAYLTLTPFPENLAALRALKQMGGELAVLSNGSPRMLDSSVRNAGMADLFTHVLSVDQVGKYKPDPAVYQMGCDAFGLPANEITFVSSNGWDISGAGWFGYKTFWVNRQGSAAERLGVVSNAAGSTLSYLVDELRKTTA
jgi:2-haloacid dehalogenase